jgi:uncharacterized repeat protein (TIGR04076 family)
MSSTKVIFEVRSASACPLYKVGDRIEFHLPAIRGAKQAPVCAPVAVAAYPAVLALGYGVPFEAAGMGKGEVGEYACPGCESGKAVFSVSKETVKEPERPSTLTMVMGKDDKRKDKDVEFIIGHLKKIDLFKPLPLASIQSIIPFLELKRFAEGTTIIQQGAPGEFLYILIKGNVDVVQTSEEGIENTLAALGKGEVVGEMSLLSKEPCSATVRSTSPVSALSVSSENFHRILDEQPSLNIYFNKLLVQRLRRQNVQVDAEISKGVLGKLSMITLPELAQTLNMSRRTGTLFLYTADQRGEIFFKDGQIHDARMGSEEGEEAFYSLLALKDGNFRFMEGEIDKARAITMDTMGLLMEGLRRLDEKEKATA